MSRVLDGGLLTLHKKKRHNGHHDNRDFGGSTSIKCRGWWICITRPHNPITTIIMTNQRLGRARPSKDHGGVGVHHKTIQNKKSNVHHWDLLCNQTTMTGNVTEKRHVDGFNQCRAPLVWCSFISIPYNPDDDVFTKSHDHTADTILIFAVLTIPIRIGSDHQLCWHFLVRNCPDELRLTQQIPSNSLQSRFSSHFQFDLLCGC